MKFYIKKKLFTVRSNFFVVDDDGKVRFKTTKGVATVRDRINLVDKDEGDAVAIKRKLFSWGAAYDIERPGEKTVTLREKWGIQRKYKIDLGGEGVIKIKPSLLRRKYRFVLDGETIATSRRPWVGLRRIATVDVSKPEYENLVLAATIAVLKTDEDKKAKREAAKATDE